MVSLKQDKEIKNILVQGLNGSIQNKIKANDVALIPNKGGHYIILSTIDVPNKPTFKIGDYFVWYNGTSANLRSRIKNHLHRRNKYTASSAIAVETMNHEEFESNTRSKDTNYFKKGNNGERYINGININEDKWENAEFFVAIIETDLYDGILEKLFRSQFNFPSLCQYKKR